MLDCGFTMYLFASTALLPCALQHESSMMISQVIKTDVYVSQQI